MKKKEEKKREKTNKQTDYKNNVSFLKHFFFRMQKVYA